MTSPALINYSRSTAIQQQPGLDIAVPRSGPKTLVPENPLAAGVVITIRGRTINVQQRPITGAFQIRETRRSAITPRFALAIPTQRGTGIQDRIGSELQRFVRQGLLEKIERGEMTSDAMHFRAFMSPAQWTDDNRAQVIGAVLDLEEALNINILVDLKVNCSAEPQ